MTMQLTSRARRVYKIRGSQAVQSGRPRQDGKVTKQLVITDDNEELFFKLPSPKKRLQKNKHNLMDLGMPSFQKNAIFLNIVQKAFDPPPLLFEHLSYFAGCVFQTRF